MGFFSAARQAASFFLLIIFKTEIKEQAGEGATVYSYYYYNVSENSDIPQH